MKGEYDQGVHPYLGGPLLSIMGRRDRPRFIIGTVLPETIQESMGIGIYAMYIALLLPEAKKSYRVAMLAILSGLTNTLIGQIPFCPRVEYYIINPICLSCGLLSRKKGGRGQCLISNY